MTLPTPVIKDLDLLDAVIRDLAAVDDWSVFWHPVNSSFLGRDYGERVRTATGWTPLLPESEMPNGTTSVTFRLPGGGGADASSDTILITHPGPMWSLVIQPEQADESAVAEAQKLATTAVIGYVEVITRQLGQPDIGPVGVSKERAPRPLVMTADGIVAGWHRAAGTIQLSAARHGGKYPSDAMNFSVRLSVRPGGRDD
jgi:hypothetical protein